jgi:hypothetical protein
MSTRQPRRAPLAEYLGGMVVFNAGLHGLLAALLSALAVSRAHAHVLSPLALAVVVTLATLGTVAFAWPNALYGGAFDALEDAVVVPPGLQSASDPFAGRTAWRTGLAWGGAATIWAAAGTALVVVALNDQRARWIVIAATWALVAGGASLAVDALARRHGALAAVRPVAAAARPLRQRAWRDIALPLALVQGGVNMVVAWLLFHDYAHVEQIGTEQLTDTVALADAVVIIVLLAATFGFVARRWGAVEATLGRVTLDGPESQSVSPKTPLGRQGVIYVGVAMYALSRIAIVALPSAPSLALVVIVRGVFTGLLVYAVAGVAFVRGALNAGVAAP